MDASHSPEKIRVLYVDDESALLDIGKVFLEQSGGFAVTTATSASEAIRLLLKTKFDAIISDYQMPEMDGIEFLKHLKAEGNTTPFIIFTGRGREDVVIEALNAGADFYLQKGGESKLQFAEMAHTIRHSVSLRQTGVALRESESKYRNLIETLQEGVWAIDKDANTAFVNPRMAEMLGYTPDEMQRRVLFDFIDEQQSENIRDKFEHLRAGIREQYESELIKKDGVRINVLIATSPVHDEKGNYSGAIAAVADITRTKKRQLEYRNLVQLNTEAMLILDTGFSIVYANPAAENIFGNSSEEIAGVPFGYPVISGELTEIKIPRRDGTMSIGEIRISDISWEDKPAHMVIIRDITERRQMEQKIQESEQSFHELFNTLGEAIYVMDVDGKFLEVNQGALDMFGQTRDFFIGQSFNRLYAPGTFDQSQTIDRLERAFNREPQTFEFAGYRSNSEIFPVECRLYRGFYFGKDVIIGLVIDITGQKKMTEQIEASLTEKETLLKEIHHRVKNNLQIITSILNMQIRKVDDPKIIEALRDGQNRVRSMALVHEHLYKGKDLSHIDLRSYISALEMELFQSYEVTNQNVRFENGIRDIFVDINVSIPLGLITNELITNSLKYAFKNRKNGKISISASEDPEVLTFVVADNGSGIPEGVTLENQASLGLRLVNILIHQLHGAVTIDRTAGTKFVFIIPKPVEITGGV